MGADLLAEAIRKVGNYLLYMYVKLLLFNLRENTGSTNVNTEFESYFFTCRHVISVVLRCMVIKFKVKEQEF